MEEGEGNMDPPFWLQTSNKRSGGRGGSRGTSIFLNSGVLFMFLLVVAFAFVFIIVPSFLNFTSQVFRPQVIKKSWDSVNLVLVLFAIVCGFLSRNINDNNVNNNESPTTSTTSYYRDRNMSNNDQKTPSHAFTPQHRWFDDQYPDRDRPVYSNHGRATLNRLRSFNSYPDLRSAWAINDDDEKWRFHDDTYLGNENNYGGLSSSSHVENQELKEEVKEDTNANVISSTKDIVVDSVQVRKAEKLSVPDFPVAESSEPTRTITRQEEDPPWKQLSPPTLPARSVVKRKVKRTYHGLGKTEKKELEVKTYYLPPPSPSPPPPPPPPPPPTPPRTFIQTTKKRGKDNFLNSLRRKEKKQRKKSVENFESLFDPLHHFSSTAASTSLLPPPSPPPPPPPPLPPPQFFQNLFSSKKSKSKKPHSFSPSPQPPDPPTTRRRPLEAHESKTKEMVPLVTVPVKTALTNFEGQNLDSGKSSPMIRTPPPPPPPPPPPFKMAAWKFVQEGDYIRVASFNGSDMDSSEELNSDRESSPNTPMEADKNSSSSNVGALFCPSPDVNTKADNFIARFRAGLRLEKVNSVKGRSNLGPSVFVDSVDAGNTNI